MSEPLLDFRKLLRMLVGCFGGREFNSREFSSLLIRNLDYFLQAQGQPVGKRYLQLMRRFNKKLISNDLRRLYSMGLLKRREVKRECKTRSGRTFFRGYEYRYMISNQGKKYLEYMINPEVQRRSESKDLNDFMMKRFIEKDAPEEKREVALAMFGDLPSKRRGFRRFSTWQGRFWTKLMEARDSRIAELEKRVKELEEENRNLRSVQHV